MDVPSVCLSRGHRVCPRPPQRRGHISRLSETAMVSTGRMLTNISVWKACCTARLLADPVPSMRINRTSGAVSINSLDITLDSCLQIHIDMRRFDLWKTNHYRTRRPLRDGSCNTNLCASQSLLRRTQKPARSPTTGKINWGRSRNFSGDPEFEGTGETL
jgi:hypothetical protein